VQVGTARVPIRTWFRLPFLAVCLAALASTLVLSGSDIGIVATMRELDAVAQIGVVLALWGLGSLVGGLLYGAMARSISPFWLLGGLALVTVPMALATSVWGLAAFGFLAGLLCAPTITATIDQASRIVPAAVRGEAMGWHGSFLTTGGALGAPIAGLAIDRRGPPAGFVTVAVVGLLVAVAGVATQRVRRSARERAQLSPR
jgi:MFS family permease